MRRLLVVLVVLALLLLGADRLGAYAAGRVVADQVRRSQDLPQTPAVSFSGFPFLTQVLRGRYDQVDVDLTSVPAAAGLRIDEVDARLRGVRLPAGDALGGRVEQVPVDRVDASVRIGFAELDDAVARAAAGSSGLLRGLRLRSGPGGGTDRLAVRLTGLPVADALAGEVSLQARNGRLAARLVPGSVDGVPAPVTAALDRLLRDALRLPPLPFGIRTTAVRVDADGLVVDAVARDVTLRAR